MRIAPLIIAAALVAGPAAAQDAFSRDRELAIRAEQDMARQRMNALQNEIHALEGQVRTEQAIRNLQSQRPTVGIVPRENSTSGAPTSAPPAGYASISDEALAQSNARVRAASGRSR